jgi:hypothetical protein
MPARLHLSDDIRELDYTIGQIVLVKVDQWRDDPECGAIVAYVVSAGDVLYTVRWASGESHDYYGFELMPRPE